MGKKGMIYVEPEVYFRVVAERRQAMEYNISLTADLAVHKRALKAASIDNARLNDCTCLVLRDIKCPYGNFACTRECDEIGDCTYRYYIEEDGNQAKETP